MPFYSELTAKIYCFNDAFRTSGNSRMFKFDSLDYVTDLIKLSLSSSNQTKKLFYGVFNTPRLASVFCFFCAPVLIQNFHFEYITLKGIKLLVRPFVYSMLTNWRMYFKSRILNSWMIIVRIWKLLLFYSNFWIIKKKNNLGENNAKNTPLNPQDCPKLSYMEKLKYKSFTSKLSYMTKSALPIKKRKASFMTTNDYRITCLLTLDDQMTLPSPSPIKSLEHMNVIYAGTG